MSSRPYRATGEGGFPWAVVLLVLVVGAVVFLALTGVIQIQAINDAARWIQNRFGAGQ